MGGQIIDASISAAPKQRKGERVVDLDRPAHLAGLGLQPHRAETFKLSTDPDFVAKVRDIVGLYMALPARPLVLCVDEKSQIQALDRSQPLLPLGTPVSHLSETPTDQRQNP